MDMVRCPFNARHEVPRVELRYHMSRCPDRAMIEPDFVYGTISLKTYIRYISCMYFEAICYAF